MFDKRIAEGEVARVLGVIAQPPNLRHQPLAGDMDGDFDRWFDGGAILNLTGSTEYRFEDGTVASIGVMPLLVVYIQFPDGRSVTVHQSE